MPLSPRERALLEGLKTITQLGDEMTRLISMMLQNLQTLERVIRLTQELFDDDAKDPEIQ